MILEEEFRQFILTREQLPAWGKYAPYNWVEKSSWNMMFMAYSQMLNEHARELSNSINDLRCYIYSLEAWSQRLSSHHNFEDKLKLIVEFIDPVATISLNLPYIIRSRFIYSIAHLSHQANQTTDRNWKDEFPLDSEVYFTTADDHCSSWRSYKGLKQALEKIANKAYENDTHKFRNLYNHRYSPRIEIGLSNFVTRTVTEEQKVKYEFGELEPLKLERIIPSLKSQHAQITKAYDLYQKLIEEHIRKIEDAEKEMTSLHKFSTHAGSPAK